MQFVVPEKLPMAMISANPDLLMFSQGLGHRRSTGHPSAQQCTRMQMQLAAARVGRLPPADRMMGRKLGSQGFTSLLLTFLPTSSRCHEMDRQ